MNNDLSEKEIQFLELLHDPIALIENLIPAAVDAPQTWNVNSKCLRVYPYQFPMMNYTMMYADDFKLTDEQNFQRKIGAGTIYNISARNIGKSLLTIDCDSVLDLIYMHSSETMLASFDEKHLTDRQDRIAQLVETHPFFKMYHLTGQKKTVNRGHKFKIQALNGYVMKGANEKVGTPQEGEQFHGIHAKIIRYDEASYMSEKGTQKRIDSVHPFGAIERYAGIPDLRIGSPLGKILYDSKKQKWVCRLPQFVQESWNEETKKKKIEEFDGQESLGFKLNVAGELIEGALGKFDIERIKSKCVTQDIKVKIFEISKHNYHHFDKLIAVERIPAEQIYICSDIGTTASPSEVIILFGSQQQNGKYFYKYRYNIPLFNLTTQEQAKVFKFLYDRLGTAFISLDCTNSDGRSIADELNILGVPEEHITRCRFGASMTVGFSYLADGKTIELDNTGNPIEKKENTLDWANSQLEELLYNGYVEIPYDQKFLKEFSAYFEVLVGNKKRYGTSTTDHHLQSWQCFAISQFLNEFKILSNQTRKKRSLGIIK
jgi:hypothetical protein